MTIKIHHGETGSYKTSGAMSDDIFPILKLGRTIVTNVRGFTRERVLENFPEYSENIDIINIDTSTRDGLFQFENWFHWIPLGSFILIDEVQLVFPKKWNQVKINSLVYPGGMEAAEKDGRPYDWDSAWDQHRHYNWDFILTAPSIKKIRDDIRGIANGGFYHRDLANLGVKGRYKEAFHIPSDNVTFKTATTIQTKKVNPDVFKLYDSTSTGEFSYSTAGIKIWKDPKLVLALSIFALSIFYAVYSFSTVDLLNRTTEEVKQEILPDVKKIVPLDIPKTVQSPTENKHVFSDIVVIKPIDKSPSIVHPYQFHEIFIKASMKSVKKFLVLFKLIKNDASFVVTSNDFYLSGYKITYISACHMKLIYDSQIMNVFCQGTDNINHVARSPGEVASQEKAAHTLSHKSLLINGKETDNKLAILN